MILSSFDSYSYNIRLDNDNSNNIYINFNISKIIIEFETKTEVFYKIFFINKDKIFFNNVNNNEHDFLNIDYKLQYFLNNIKTIFVNKNLLSELIINYLIMSDDELEIYCLNSFKNKKLLLLFFFYMHNEI